MTHSTQSAVKRGHPGAGRKRTGKTPKGRQVEPKALVEVQALLGSEPRRRDLLIRELIDEFCGGMADGNCRACMVEIEGERVLSASCLRKPTESMKRHSANERARTAQRMVLTTGRQLEHWHTGAMTRRATVLDELEPEAVATLAPGDKSRMGVEPGSMVRVSTRRGVLELRARADGAVPSGMVLIPFCYAEAPANVLKNQALDPFGKIPEFKFCAAKVEAV